MSGVLGKYRLDKRLGGGGMAEVFLGSSIGAEGFSRRVAIKRVLPGFSDNQAFADMFRAEAQISSQLVHPNIVSVLDFDRDPEGRLFLVMELVEGKDLDHLVQTGLLPVPVVIFIISEVLRGLGHAHDLPVGANAHGVIHRDVSPHNVLLGWEGAVKVSDFGIAKAKSASEATASVFIKGKPAYMSPEQANGQALDGRSDLFAVGIMLWEMLVGRRLFVGEDTRSILAAVLFGQVPRPRALRPDVPKDVERVCMKLLERELTARYATAEDALADLLACPDAPKNGREALNAVLLERFPNEAPVRHSVMRARSIPPGQHSVPTPGPHGMVLASPGQQTFHEQPGHANAPALSLGAMMNAPTGTIDHGRPIAPPRAPRKAGSKVALIVIITVASALLTFGIATALKGGGAAPGAATGSSAPGDAGAIAMTPVDAPPPPPPPPVDAALAAVLDDAGAGSATDATPPTTTTQAEPSRKYGTLQVKAFPVLTVYVDGKRLNTSLDPPARVPAGRHQMKLTYGNGQVYKVESITVPANKPLVLRYSPPPLSE